MDSEKLKTQQGVVGACCPHPHLTADPAQETGSDRASHACAHVSGHGRVPKRPRQVTRMSSVRPEDVTFDVSPPRRVASASRCTRDSRAGKSVPVHLVLASRRESQPGDSMRERRKRKCKRAKPRMNRRIHSFRRHTLFDAERFCRHCGQSMGCRCLSRDVDEVSLQPPGRRTCSHSVASLSAYRSAAHVPQHRELKLYLGKKSKQFPGLAAALCLQPLSSVH